MKIFGRMARGWAELGCDVETHKQLNLSVDGHWLHLQWLGVWILILKHWLEKNGIQYTGSNMSPLHGYNPSAWALTRSTPVFVATAISKAKPNPTSPLKLRLGNIRMSFWTSTWRPWYQSNPWRLCLWVGSIRSDYVLYCELLAQLTDYRAQTKRE